MYEKSSDIKLSGPYTCKTRGSDKFLTYDIPIVMVYIVFINTS